MTRIERRLIGLAKRYLKEAQDDTSYLKQETYREIAIEILEELEQNEVELDGSEVD